MSVGSSRDIVQAQFVHHGYRTPFICWGLINASKSKCIGIYMQIKIRNVNSTQLKTICGAKRQAQPPGVAN